MADMVALFSNVGTHVPFFKKEQMHKAIPAMTQPAIPLASVSRSMSCPGATYCAVSQTESKCQRNAWQCLEGAVSANRQHRIWA